MHIREKIERIMADQSMTQTELAELSGTNQPLISAALAGKRDLRVATLEKIAAALGHHVALIPGDPPE